MRDFFYVSSFFSPKSQNLPIGKKKKSIHPPCVISLEIVSKELRKWERQWPVCLLMPWKPLAGSVMDEMTASLNIDENRLRQHSDNVCVSISLSWK